MIDAPERIRAWARWRGNQYGSGHHCTHLSESEYDTEYVRKDIAFPTPTVKPLVWQQSTYQKHEGCVEYAETITGTYFISYDNDDFTGYYCDFVFLGNCQWFGTGGANSREILSGLHDDDLTTIKTAVQADHTARILSALEVK